MLDTKSELREHSLEDTSNHVVKFIHVPVTDSMVTCLSGLGLGLGLPRLPGLSDFATFWITIRIFELYHQILPAD